jgi:hypothetical protein
LSKQARGIFKSGLKGVPRGRFTVLISNTHTSVSLGSYLSDVLGHVRSNEPPYDVYGIPANARAPLTTALKSAIERHADRDGSTWSVTAYEEVIKQFRQFVGAPWEPRVKEIPFNKFAEKLRIETCRDERERRVVRYLPWLLAENRRRDKEGENQIAVEPVTDEAVEEIWKLILAAAGDDEKAWSDLDRTVIEPMYTFRVGSDSERFDSSGELRHGRSHSTSLYADHEDEVTPEVEFAADESAPAQIAQWIDEHPNRDDIERCSPDDKISLVRIWVADWLLEKLYDAAAAGDVNGTAAQLLNLGDVRRSPLRLFESFVELLGQRFIDIYLDALAHLGFEDPEFPPGSVGGT